MDLIKGQNGPAQQDQSSWILTQEDAARITHPDLRKLYNYWDSKRQGRLAPTRADIDPLDFPQILPWMHIFKVLRQKNSQELDYKTTLFGTKLVQHLDQDLTGKLFSEIFTGPESVPLKATYDRTTACGDVCFSELNAGWLDKEYIHYKRLLLPLSDDGVQVNRLLGCSYRIPFDEMQLT